MLTNWLEMVATKLGVDSDTVIMALLAFLVLIIISSLFRRRNYKRMVAAATKKTIHNSSWGTASTSIPAISSPPKASSTMSTMPTNKINTLSPTPSAIPTPSAMPMPSAMPINYATNLPQPTDVELPKIIIKQLQGVVADTGKLKALFNKIDKLDTIVTEIGKLEDLTVRIDRIEAIVASLEKLHPPSSPALSYKHAVPSAAPAPPIPPPQQAQPPPIPPISSAEIDNHKMLLSEGSDLPEALHGFFAVLIAKRIWEEKEIRRVALKNGLIYNDAIDTINAWAYEKCGDYLIVDDNGQFIVQKDIFARGDNPAVSSPS